MTQDDGGYDLQPLPEGAKDKPALPPPDSPDASSAGAGSPKFGEAGWIPPVPIIEKADENDVTPEEIANAQNAADIEKHKITAALGYLFFVVPLIAAPNSKFARYHANQGLLLFILLFVIVMAVALFQGGSLLAGYLLRGRIDLLATFFGCGFVLLQIALLVGWLALLAMGTLHAMNGLTEPLPVIGHWTLIEQHVAPATGAAASGPVPAQTSTPVNPVASQEEKKP